MRGSDLMMGSKRFTWEPGHVAKSQWESKHRLEGYQVRAPTKPHAGGPLVDLCFLLLYFPRGMDFGDKHLTIRPEFSAPGTRHPKVYATQALDIDPACRLAIRSIGVCKDGTSFDIFLHRDPESAVFRANAFVDRVLDGKSIADIKRLPRRYIPPYQLSSHERTPSG
ncbi:hypothetical protein BR93DRAFT_170020 [Coniochaeta sp. PMI_546]|nr:hypothetical protein BR93DRAFT_170020 [Coniochaeta sp. PMI_546]